MGTLLPTCGNITYSGAGALSPLSNDPNFRTIGGGVSIFLCGGTGMIIGEGTQHSPAGGFGTLSVTGDMKEMRPEFLRAATMHQYGVTLYVGLGVPIPILSLEMVQSTAIRDDQITVDVLDYGVPRRDRPSFRKISYAELKSGKVELNGEEVRTSSLSSYRKAREVAHTLQDWIKKGKFELTLPTRRIDPAKSARPMRETARVPRVRDIMNTNVVSISEDESIRNAARKLLKGDTNHLPVLNREGALVGIVTTYDVSKAVVKEEKNQAVKDVMTTRVIKTAPDEHVDVAAQKLERYNISALPVVDEQNRMIGMLTAIDLGKLFGKRWQK
jgi:CBS domain-containing protein